MAPRRTFLLVTALTLLLCSITSALPLERRRNPLAIIVGGGGGKGSNNNNHGQKGISIGLGLHRPIGQLLGHRSDDDRAIIIPPHHRIPSKKRSAADDEMHILPYPYKSNGETTEQHDKTIVKRGAQAQGYKPGGPGSGGQYDKGQPFGRHQVNAAVSDSDDPFGGSNRIPEIVERVAVYLDRTSITTATRVQKSWYQAWLPVLWHTIDDGHHWHNSRFLEALAKHGDLIRVLYCSRYDEIDMLLPSAFPQQQSALCKNLTTLVLPKTTSANESQHAQLIRQNPNLKKLNVIFHDELSSEFSDLTNAIGQLKHLHSLAFNGNKKLQVSTLESILKQCSSTVASDGSATSTLQELSLCKTFFLKHPFGTGEEFASGLLATSDPSTGLVSHDTMIENKELFAVTTLLLDSVACTQDLVLNLTSRFPHLTKLSMREAAEIYLRPDFPTRLAQRCPNIKTIDVSDTVDMEDSTIFALISNFPSLHTLHVSDTGIGSPSLNALADHCRNLTVLTINSAFDIDGVAIQRILSACWSLQKLEAWDCEIGVVQMMTEALRASNNTRASTSITSSDVVTTDGEPWACRGLQYLTLKVSYSTLDLTPQEEQLFPSSRARRFIYDQLARLTNLRYLALATSSGNEHDDDDDDDDDHEHTKDPSNSIAQSVRVGRHSEADNTKDREDMYNDSIWIDYSFQSGLRRLEPLKELRTLGLYDTLHKIKLGEIQWMVKAWPHLSRFEYFEHNMQEDSVYDIMEYVGKHYPWIEFADDE
ncbi:hypothetical protein BGZ94_002799 [Podila epigama]|nr:hypothetical protein BGZ94_002799 [Podila epigama]